MNNNAVAPLKAENFPRCCDPEQFDFKTTSELEPLSEIIGQDRALEAIRFGVGMKNEGYNLFVLGPPGTGKFTAINQYLQGIASKGCVPSDWCYVNNFDDATKPILLELPPGRGSVLRNDMRRLVEDLLDAIPTAFDSDEYKARAQQIEAELRRSFGRGDKDGDNSTAQD